MKHQTAEHQRQDLLLRLQTNCMTFTLFMYLNVCPWKESPKTCKQTHMQLGWYLHLLTKPFCRRALSSHHRMVRGQLLLPCVSKTTLKCHDFLSVWVSNLAFLTNVRQLRAMTASCQFYFNDSGLDLLDSWLLWQLNLSLWWCALMEFNTLSQHFITYIVACSS